MENKVKRVLVIAESKIDTFVSQKVIERTRFAKHVTVKYSASEALKLLRLRANQDVLPDIIFLDINMPYMDGFRFIQKFDQLPHSIRSKCKIVILSSSDHSDDFKTLTNHPSVADLILKPLDESGLDRIQQISLVP